MAKKLSMREAASSQNAVNCCREHFGREFRANVMVKQKSANSEVCKCTIDIGYGRYIDHNMPYVSIDWPDQCTIPERFDIHSDFDCAYVKIRYDGSGLLTIYPNKEVTIDICVLNNDEEDDVETECE